ncbi:MAG: HD domain-containing protein [Nitrospiraceae bacterium]|nr:HD domain-containing protein [Nitrospiraceae bacterium]
MTTPIEEELQHEGSYATIPLTSLRTDSIADFDVFFRPQPHQPLVLYAKRNVPFTEQARKRLVASHLYDVFIHESDLGAYNRYMESNLQAIINDPRIRMQEKVNVLYAAASSVVEQLLRAPPDLKTVRRSREIVGHTVNFILSDERILSQMMRAIASVYHIYTHSVNVLIYCVALAQRAGYGHPSTLRELASGALVHDIGKGKIDPALLTSPNPLTENQWESMRRHPVYGYEMLAPTGSLGEIALDIVLHHHENVNGDGYPDGLAPELLSPFVRMVTIADCFDALTTERPFQAANNTFDALTLMRDQIALGLDPELFKIFVSMMGSIPQ